MKVRVVHIITQLELGGAQQNTLYTVAHLDRRRYEPVLVAGCGGPLVEEAEGLKDVRKYYIKELVRSIRPFCDAVALFRLYALMTRLRKEAAPRPVIVHTHSSKAGIIGRMAAYMAGVPVIVHTVHGFGFNDGQGALRRNTFIFLERLVSRVTTRFVAVAEDNIRKGVEKGVFSHDRAEVIRSGFNTGYFKKKPADLGGKRAEIGLPDNAPVATMVSCLKPQKAPVDFVRVAARVLESVPDAYFVLVGDGELRDEVQAEAARLGLDGRFRMLGWRGDVRAIMHASDVIVLTSLWEGLPKVVPQAMAAGKPVVATAVDGTPEAVRDGVGGFLARPHDLDYIADKVALLLKDRGLAMKMGEAGRCMVEEFDEVEMLKRIEALYERLLEEAV